MPDYYIERADKLPDAIVERYFSVRDTWNKVRNNAPDFHGHRDQFDSLEHIAIATDGTKCFGGVRANIARKGSPLLPMEQNGLRLPTLFREFELDTKNYVELSKFIVCDDANPMQLNNMVMYHLIEYCFNHYRVSHEISYLFCWSGKKHMRLYRIMGRFFNVSPTVHRVDDHLVPKQCLAMGEIHVHGYPLPGSSSHQSRSNPELQKLEA